MFEVNRNTQILRALIVGELSNEFIHRSLPFPIFRTPIVSFSKKKTLWNSGHELGLGWLINKIEIRIFASGLDSFEMDSTWKASHSITENNYIVNL